MATVLEVRQPVHQVSSQNVQYHHTVVPPPAGTAVLLKQHDHEDKDTTILRNVRKHTLVQVA
jgi:hypothetical protein